jgi:outer membrane protein, adhesin transport system
MRIARQVYWHYRRRSSRLASSVKSLREKETHSTKAWGLTETKSVKKKQFIQVPLTMSMTNRRIRKPLVSAIGLLALIGFSSAYGAPMTLKSVAQKAVVSNPEVLAKYHLFEASEGELEAVTSAMLPHVDLIASKGREDLNQPTIRGRFNESTQTLQLTQLLWDGLGSWYQKRQFDHARLVRLYEFFDASENAALEVSRAYFDVLRYRRLVELAEGNYVQHRSVYEQIEAKVKAGVGRRVDFEQASGRLALAESNLVVEISNLHDVSARFQRLVGEPPGKEMEAPALLAGGTPATVKQALEVAYTSNSQVRAAVENVRASAYARDARRGAYQPKVEFRLREDRGSDLNGISGKTRNHVAELLLNFNLFNGFGDVGRVDQASELYHAARDQRDKACRDVRQTLEIAYNDVRKLIEQKKYLEQHRLSVEKARDAYRKQFDIGQRSLLDLLDTENELFQAQRAEVNADLDLATAYARVHAGEGKILQVLGLSTIKNELSGETKDWAAGEESPEQCPPDPVVTYVSNKDQLNERATEMTREKVKIMLDAIAARKDSQGDTLLAPVAVAPVRGAPNAIANGGSNSAYVVVAPVPGTASPVAPGAGKAIGDALNEWANAWMSRDTERYLGYYSPTFLVADGRRREAWMRDRRAVLSKSEEIRVVLSSRVIEVRDASHAFTRFHQRYSSKGYSDEVEKTLDWQMIDGRWLIVAENGTPSPATQKPGQMH